MLYNDADLAAAAIAARIDQAKQILILTHINPDGDAIGSMLGVWHALQALGKDGLPMISSSLPGYSKWLPGAEHIRIYQQGMAFPEVDLVMMVDTATLARIGRIYDEHSQSLAAVPTLVIDHHVTNEGAGTINLIQPRQLRLVSCCCVFRARMRGPRNGNLPAAGHRPHAELSDSSTSAERCGRRRDTDGADLAHRPRVTMRCRCSAR